MLVKLEDFAVVGALALEHRRRIMQSVCQDVEPGLAPRHQLAIEPDPAVAVVEARFLGCHSIPCSGRVTRLMQARALGKRPGPGCLREFRLAPRGSIEGLADELIEAGIAVEHRKARLCRTLGARHS